MPSKARAYPLSSSSVSRSQMMGLARRPRLASSALLNQLCDELWFGVWRQPGVSGYSILPLVVTNQPTNTLQARLTQHTRGPP